MAWNAFRGGASPRVVLLGEQADVVRECYDLLEHAGRSARSSRRASRLGRDGLTGGEAVDVVVVGAIAQHAPRFSASSPRLRGSEAGREVTGSGRRSRLASSSFERRHCTNEPALLVEACACRMSAWISSRTLIRRLVEPAPRPSAARSKATQAITFLSGIAVSLAPTPPARCPLGEPRSVLEWPNVAGVRAPGRARSITSPCDRRPEAARLGCGRV